MWLVNRTALFLIGVLDCHHWCTSTIIKALQNSFSVVCGLID